MGSSKRKIIKTNNNNDEGEGRKTTNKRRS